MKTLTESIYTALNESVINSEPMNEAVEESESNIDEYARYLFDQAEGDVDYIPSFEETNDYIMEIDEDTYNKAYEIAKKALETVSEHSYNGMLELSDNHTLWELEDSGKSDEEWWSIVNSKFAAFEAETGVEVWQDGRMGRHIVVENNFENAVNYDKLCEVQKKLEQEAIDEFNAKEEDNNEIEQSDIE